jgi:rubrerythrin
MNKIKDILKFAMRMEQDAADFYSYYMDKAQSENTRKLFTELAAIETKHYLVLKSKFDELGFQDPPITMSWVVDNAFISKDPHILADISDIAENHNKDASDLSIIRMAYLIENDFALFYKNAIDTVEDIGAKKFLSELSQWETQHKELFYNKYQELLKKHWSNISSIILP